MNQRWRQWLQTAFGPWPLSPGLAFFVLTIIGLSQNLFVALLVPEYAVCRITCNQIPHRFFPGLFAGENALEIAPVDGIGLTLNAIVPSAAAALVFVTSNRILKLRFFERPSRSVYLVTLVLAATASMAVRFLVYPVIPDTPTLQRIIIPLTRQVVVLLIVQASLGRYAQRYEQARIEAQNALTEVRRQQGLVIAADEKSRREVATFLHDRVQAGLLVTALRMRQASTDVKPEVQELLETAIHDLERMRSEDVRGAGRRLSPDFVSVGLDSALQELASSWKAAMNVSISMDAKAHRHLHENADNDLVTAVYRTVEQGLLNAAAHGHANHVQVSLTMPSALVLTIEDDGSGLSEEAIPGAGSAIISAWMSNVGGAWTIANGPERGVVVTVKFNAEDTQAH